MKKTGVILMLLLSAVICSTQAVNFSGVVKNSAGTGLEGVKVRLGKAAIMTTTAQDGSFTLRDGTGPSRGQHRTFFDNGCRFRLENGTLFFSLSRQAKIGAAAYDCNGKLLASHGPVVASVNFSLPFLQSGSGIRLYRVTVDDEMYVFRHLDGIGADRPRAHSFKAIDHANLAVEAAARIDDALLFIKEGYQLRRIAVTKPDSSGMQISMTPLTLGTMTDSDGNEYRTVKIGNQEWMAENLRTTKYNDGSSIGNNYHFYNNTTDAAAKKKWGALYNQTAAKSGKLAPKGWHLPTNADWDTLKNYLITNGYNYDGTTSENKIAKAMSETTYWEESLEPGGIGADLRLNNASGFSALPAGWRYWQNNVFKEQGSHTYWWSATQHDGTYTCVYNLWSINFDLNMSWWTLVECSVRLVRDN